MTTRGLFGISIAMSFLSSVLAAVLLVWPRLNAMDINHALIWLVAPHMFLRFIGLSFLIPGVVSPSLPRDWAAPAAYGDLLSGILAIVAIVALTTSAHWAITAVWVFNVVGAADLLFAFYKGARVRLDPGSLGAAFYIVTSIVPPLLMIHALVFMLLVKA